MVSFLKELDWKYNPWGESLRGAGIYTALVLNCEVTQEWKDCYFAWLFDNSDPESGFFRRGCVLPVEASGVESFFPHLGGTFEKAYSDMESALQGLFDMPNPLIDTCPAHLLTGATDQGCCETVWQADATTGVLPIGSKCCGGYAPQKLTGRFASTPPDLLHSRPLPGP